MHLRPGCRLRPPAAGPARRTGHVRPGQSLYRCDAGEMFFSRPRRLLPLLALPHPFTGFSSCWLPTGHSHHPLIIPTIRWNPPLTPSEANASEDVRGGFHQDTRRAEATGKQPKPMSKMSREWMSTTEPRRASCTRLQHAVHHAVRHAVHRGRIGCPSCSN